MAFQNKSFFEDGVEAGGESSIIFRTNLRYERPHL
jgi:hypothetical protein